MLYMSFAFMRKLFYLSERQENTNFSIRMDGVV